MVCELEQEFVARDQKLGLAACCENQEFLIVCIAATRQGVGFIAFGIAQKCNFFITGDQFRPPGRIKRELRIAGYSFEFSQALRVSKTLQSSLADSGFQRLCVPVVKVQHVHHDVGVKNEVHWRAQKNSQL